MYSQYTDIDLVFFLQSGDEAAFTEIYRRYWDLLFYLAGKKPDDLPEAESVVQEIYFDLWKRRSQLNIRVLDDYLVVAVKYRILNILAHREKKDFSSNLPGKITRQQNHISQRIVGIRGRTSAPSCSGARSPGKGNRTRFLPLYPIRQAVEAPRGSGRRRAGWRNRRLGAGRITVVAHCRKGPTARLSPPAPRRMTWPSSPCGASINTCMAFSTEPPRFAV